MNHLAAENRADALRAEAHAEQRMSFRRGLAQDRIQTAGILRPARPGSDDDGIVARQHAVDQPRIIVADHIDFRARTAEEMREVMRERVVVVHQ